MTRMTHISPLTPLAHTTPSRSGTTSDARRLAGDEAVNEASQDAAAGGTGAGAAPAASATSKPPRRSRRAHHLGRVMQVDRHTTEARRQAVCVLEVLAGVRTPEQAAQALELSLQSYYNLESRALRGLMRGCTPDPRGRPVEAQKEIDLLSRRCAELEQQVQRHQALLRSAQRVAGFVPETPATRGKGAKPVQTATGQMAKSSTGRGTRQKRKPTVRALRAIEAIDPGATRGRPGGATDGSAVASSDASGAPGDVVAT